MVDQAKTEEKFDDSAIVELMGYDKWPRDVSLAFDRARGVLSLAYIKNRQNLKDKFATVVADLRALEAEYLERLGDNAENALQVRRIITEMLWSAAWHVDQPFETCLQYWNDLQQLGFYRIERRCLQSGAFAACCREYGQTEIGLGVLDPLIAELERLRAEPTVTEEAAAYYDEEIGSLRKLRARLEAERD